MILEVDIYGFEEGFNSYSGMNLLSNNYFEYEGFPYRSVITKDTSEAVNIKIVSVNNFLRNFIVTYKEGLGFTDLSFFREGDHTTKTVKLVCYTKNNVSVGDCSILDKILSNAAKEESEGISIYPNPAIEQITISPISENAEGNKVSIYNSLGRKVYNKNLMQGVSSHSINIENFIPGLYYAEIQGKNLVRKSFVKY